MRLWARALPGRGRQRATGGVAVVTGGGSGIGAAIATGLAGSGCSVAVVGRNERALQSTATSLEGADARVVARVCDVRSPDEARRVTAEVENALGPITILVNNAGGWTGESLVQLDDERLDELVDTMVKGTMHMSRAVLPGMIERRGGFILNIGSVSGLPVSRDSAASSAPKAAVASLTHTLQQEVRQYGIRVAVLHPDHVKSAPSLDLLVDKMQRDGKYTHISAAQVAEIALFMLFQPANVLIPEAIVVPSGVDM